MIWKNLRKKIKWEFNPEYQKEGTKRINNPVRGWYAIYTFHIEDTIDPEELKWSLRDGESLALLRIDISKYKAKKLDQRSITNLKIILKFFQRYQKDVILRAVYDIEGRGQEMEPDDFDMVLMHLNQIGQVLSEEEHSVFLVQGMLVGSWGEMHDSKFLSKKHLLKMWECIGSYLSEDIYCAVRTPAQWRLLSEQKDHNLSIFDDALFGSISHLGTFGMMTREAAGWYDPWNSKEELSFLNEICKKRPCGGEALLPSDGKEYTDKEVIRQMRQMHLVYLNAVYDQRILDIWRQTKIRQSRWDTLFDYIGDHLGYRFVVADVKIQKVKRKGIWISGTIKNTGFGALVQEAELILIVQHDHKSEEYMINIDLQDITDGMEKEFEVIVDRQEADIFLKMQRKKDHRTIFFANEDATDKLYLGYLRQI